MILVAVADGCFLVVATAIALLVGGWWSQAAVAKF
jgi:hypothetical protein